MERKIQEQRRLDLRTVMALPAGRRVMYDLIFGAVGWAGCDLMNVYPAQDSGVYRHEGRREVAVEMVADLQDACPELFIQMFSERILQQRRNETIPEEDTDNG